MFVLAGQAKKLILEIERRHKARSDGFYVLIVGLACNNNRSTFSVNDTSYSALSSVCLSFLLCACEHFKHHLHLFIPQKEFSYD